MILKYSPDFVSARKLISNRGQKWFGQKIKLKNGTSQSMRNSALLISYEIRSLSDYLYLDRLYHTCIRYRDKINP